MTGFPEIKVPRPDELDLEFFQAVAKAGALHIQRCSACSTWRHPPTYYCPHCASGEYSFAAASGRAKVYSYTVSHMSVEPQWQALVPYVTIVAELEEGPRIVAAAKDLAADKVALGMPIRIVTETKSPDFAVFLAERAEGETS